MSRGRSGFSYDTVEEYLRYLEAQSQLPESVDSRKPENQATVNYWNNT